MAQVTVTPYPQLKGGDNFQNWKFRLNALLEEKKCKDVTQGLVAATDADYADKEAKAKNIIINSLSDKYLEYVKGKSTSKEMLDALESVFARKSVATKTFMRKQLLLLKFKEGQNLEEHFGKFDRLVSQLEAAAGKSMDDDDKVSHLLLTMPSSYDSVVTAIETITSTTCTLDFVKTRLLEFEKKQAHVEGASSIDTGFITCYECNQPGHKSFNCPDRNNQRRGNRGGYGQRRRSRGRTRYGHSNRGQSHQGQARMANNGQEEEINFLALDSQHHGLNCCSTVNPEQVNFFLDSGASDHLVHAGMEKSMVNVKQLENPVLIKIANGEVIKAEKKGTLKMYYRGKKFTLDALIVDKLTHNLLSVNELTKDKEKKVVFKSDYSHIVIRRGFVLTFKKTGKSYIVSLDLNPTVLSENVTKNQSVKHEAVNNKKVKTVQSETVKNEMLTNDIPVKYKVEAYSTCEDPTLWHRRMGHLSRGGLKALNMPFTKEICESCIKGKATRLPFKKCELPRSSRIGQLIHTDLSGPYNPPTLNGERYFQTIVDDYSHFTTVYLLKHKDEAIDNVINYVNNFKNQSGSPVSRIRCDRGGEFKNTKLENFCLQEGSELELNMSYTSQQNGVSERMNRTLLDKARSMMDDTDLPKSLWGESVRAAAYLLNRSPSSAIQGNIPASRWFRSFDYSKIRVFGCKAWACVLPRVNKLDNRAIETRFVGYCTNGYRLYDIKSRKIILSRDVRFDERPIKKENFLVDDNIKFVVNNPDDKLSSTSDDSKNSSSTSNNNQESSTTSDEPASTSESEREETPDEDDIRSSPEKKRPQRERQLPVYLRNDYELYSSFSMLATQDDPVTYKEAIESDDGWQTAINEELKAHEKLGTWSEVDQNKLQADDKIIRTKWIFKTKENGNKKARLVAKGYEENVDKQNVYSPVARLSTIRLLLSVALHNNWKIRQFDIPTAFLNGNLTSDVYIYPPPGANVEGGKILKLNKALYGLRSSPKVWNETIDCCLLEDKFERSKADCCLYIKRNIYVGLFVDDFLGTGEDKALDSFGNLLKNKFNAKDLGEARDFVGLEITRGKDHIKISQERMINKVIEKFGQTDSKKTAHIPLHANVVVKPTDEIINKPYRQLIGSLLYISLGSRPDIAYATIHLSRFVEKPTQEAWGAALQVVKYLKTTSHLALIYERSKKEPTLQAVSDADWASSIEDRKSVSGGVIFYHGNPILWLSRKQDCVATSSSEAEYISASTLCQEAMNLRQIHKDLTAEDVTVDLFMDNQSAMSMANKYENGKRSRHIDVKYHQIKDLTQKGAISVSYVPTESNVADIFTKPLGRTLFMRHRNTLGVIHFV